MTTQEINYANRRTLLNRLDELRIEQAACAGGRPLMDVWDEMDAVEDQLEELRRRAGSTPEGETPA